MPRWSVSQSSRATLQPCIASSPRHPPAPAGAYTRAFRCRSAGCWPLSGVGAKRREQKSGKCGVPSETSCSGRSTKTEIMLHGAAVLAGHGAYSGHGVNGGHDEHALDLQSGWSVRAVPPPLSSLDGRGPHGGDAKTGQCSTGQTNVRLNSVPTHVLYRVVPSPSLGGCSR